MVKKISELLKGFDSRSVLGVRKLHFSGVGGKDVYNPSVPFWVGGTRYLLARVEDRERESMTETVFFKRPKGSRNWVADESLPVLPLQDPFVTAIRGRWVVGGVEVENLPRKKHLSYRMVFYRGRDLRHLKKFAHGPWGMKGVRLVELPGGKVGVFTRPQGAKGGRGKIGFTIVDSLSSLRTRVFSRAPLIEGQFGRGEWGGPNDVHVLGGRTLGVVGHIAKFTRGTYVRHYFPIVFEFDFVSREAGLLKIIARRKDFPKDGAKRDDMYDVVYPGGLVRSGDRSELFVGVGDAQSYVAVIKDPFSGVRRK